MSSRGTASPGAKRYGTEYTTLHTSGNIKFIRYNDADSAKPPMSTQTAGRIYGVISTNDELRTIVFFDETNNRYKQIDVEGTPHKIDGEYVIPHTHYGFYHDENGTYKPTPDEQKIVDKMKRIWYNFLNSG